MKKNPVWLSTTVCTAIGTSFLRRPSGPILRPRSIRKGSKPVMKYLTLMRKLKEPGDYNLLESPDSLMQFMQESTIIQILT